MLSSIILLGGLVSAFGLGAISPNQEKQDNVQFRLENHKSVQYDDEDYDITLTADELNNYHWENLFQFFVDTSETLVLSDSAIVYQSHSYVYDDHDAGLEYLYGDFNINTPAYGGESLYFIFSDTTYGEASPFESNITWSIGDSEYYTAIKQAIELDIQANQPSQNVGNVMVQFVDILVSGIVSLGSGVANGIVAMATALFLQVDNGSVTGLSVFGGIVAIFAGLALAVGITSKVYQWVTSLGN